MYLDNIINIMLYGVLLLAVLACAAGVQAPIVRKESWWSDWEIQLWSCFHIINVPIMRFVVF